MNETGNVHKLLGENSSSLLCAFSFALFVLFVVCAQEFNNIVLINIWHLTMTLLFPLGIVVATVISAIQGHEFLNLQSVSRKSIGLLVPCILVAALILVLVIGNGSMIPVFVAILFTPVLVMSELIFACVMLVRSGVSYPCAIFLFASIALALAAVPLMLTLGVQENVDTIELHPQIFVWILCVIVSTILCTGSNTSKPHVSAEPVASTKAERHVLVVLWTLTSALWLIVLHWVMGITEKGA